MHIFIYATFYLSTYLLIQGSIVSISWLYWEMLQLMYECTYLFNILSSLTLKVYPLVRLLDHIIPLLIFSGTSIVFSAVAASICISSTVHKYSFFFRSSPTLIISYLLDDSYFNRCEAIPHCSFDFHFLDD